LWQVERGASKVFLFGETVGVRREDAWLSEPIRRAVDGCREFWCEVADADEIAACPSGEYGLGEQRSASKSLHGWSAMDLPSRPRSSRCDASIPPSTGA
jgi:hypothetical protein